MARAAAGAYLKQREEMGYPLLRNSERAGQDAVAARA